MKFQPVSNKVDFPKTEEDVLAFWEAQGIFQKSVDQRKGGREFVFYDGPPFATGLPHYGHLLAGTIKDIVPRYQTMRGHYVERRFGWDCHGLPIEELAQKALGLEGSTAILEAGVDVFNEQCRSMVMTYVNEWRKTVTRMGRWVDFDNDYKTMDPAFMETIWWVFKQLWDQGRIYKAHRIMPYTWKLTTPLSNFEANRNYQDVQDPAITCRFKLTDPARFGPEAYFLAWTTTPWTLPSNLALCVGPEIEYVAVRDTAEGSVYVLAEARLGAYYKKESDYEVVARCKGADLTGLGYVPLFDFFADHANSFVVLSDGYVTTEDGTGIVHIAPAYGEDDYRVGRAAGIELVDPLDAEANFTAAVPPFEGQNCKEADKGIIRALKDMGKLVHQSTIQHSYPFCDRSDTPLIYRAIDAWYVKVEDLKDRMTANNNGVHWMPEYVGSKRFGNWLADAKDWNISRNRFWGSCIPVWVSEDGEDSICVGSIAELEALSGQTVTDLHKHIVDGITFEKDGKTYRRTPEVLDCWFESGAMPYAQQHYPFENAEGFMDRFPADFIAEGLDQTRGWFYTLMVLSTALFDKPAFRNVVVNGLVLAENGQKMSKRLKNYPDPVEVVDRCGADAVRLYMIYSPVVRAENLAFSEDGVKQILRDLLIPMWNAYSFFVTYANTDGWDPAARAEGESDNLLDRWILSSMENLSGEVTAALDRYDLQSGVRPFVHFIEDLCNWYIRRSRRRFWKSEDDADKAQAYRTLYDVLITLCKIGAPFVPFITESIYRNLRTEDMPESVHLCDYPQFAGEHRDAALDGQMAVVQTVVRLGRSLRSEYDLKVRMPLKGIHVATRDMSLKQNIDELKHLVMDELNVKEVCFGEEETALATYSAKPNFKTMGPKLGAKIKVCAGAVAKLDTAEISRVLQGGGVDVDLGGESMTLGAEDLLITRVPREGLAVASEGAIVVALETELTPELEREGLAREFVSRVQNLRKLAGLEVSDRIAVRFRGSETVTLSVSEHRKTVMEEVLALELESVADLSGETHDLNGEQAVIELAKA
ncbi:MAG: isoleucine--tRNA ligase [Verrucomicrobia bacterium]|nr:isoleucine--tRNA ligase [Verrucomicrobiota bacterium]MCH8527583.1 isoleucine--tRNA ligase [Kiritimatiellia bacterium]